MKILEITKWDFPSSRGMKKSDFLREEIKSYLPKHVSLLGEVGKAVLMILIIVLFTIILTV